MADEAALSVGLMESHKLECIDRSYLDHLPTIAARLGPPDVTPSGMLGSNTKLKWDLANVLAMASSRRQG
jgi:hypothetical protein